MIHSQALKFHSQAFDAEAAGAANAKLKWQNALDNWGKLMRNEAFWQSIKAKGRKLEPSLFDKDESINQLRDALPKFLLEIHTTYILNSIDIDIRRAGYHFELIRHADLGQTQQESRRYQDQARLQIYRQRLREDLLEQKEENQFELAVRLAEAVHLLDPTEHTATFMLKAYLTWVKKYEGEQLEIIRQNYPEYAEITRKIESEEDEFEYVDILDEIYDEIRDDEEILEVQEEQTALMDDLEAMAEDALECCDKNKPSNRLLLTQALYFVGRHYCTTPEVRDVDTAIDYLEEAMQLDPANEAARVLLEQLNAIEDWE